MTFSEKTLVTETELPLDIISKRCLKLVILSNDESIVEMADKVAQQKPLGVERNVIWIKSPNISTIVKQLPEIGDSINDCIAFSLSTINKVGLSIDVNSPINFVRLDRAFIKAGKNQNN